MPYFSVLGILKYDSLVGQLTSNQLQVMVSNSLGNLPEDLEDQGLTSQQLGGKEAHDFVENFPNQPGPGGQQGC